MNRKIQRNISIILFFILLFVGANVLEAAAPRKGKVNPRVASFWEKAGNKIVKCLLCPRKCVLKNGQRGICTVRINKEGTLYTLGYGNPVAVHIDPIEKKPFFNVTPGEPTLSIAVAGCNMRCLFCQNWQISQSPPDQTYNYDLTPQQIVDMAIMNNCKYVVYTYTEPTVFYEYMLETAKEAKKRNIRNAMHSCGYINPEPLRELLKYMEAVNIDLKGFSEEFYAKMGLFAQLEPVLETLKIIKEEGVWLEITNLIIPGMNDDPEQIRQMCEWIKENLGDDVPIHFSRFMPTYKLANLPPTPVGTLEKAYDIAKEEGLKYVYIGNIPGHSGENTYCPNCGKKIIERRGYLVRTNSVKDYKCQFCGEEISGRWGF